MTVYLPALFLLLASIYAAKAASPSTTLTWPTFQREVRGDLFISGTATADESGVDYVDLVVENKDTKSYWNGVTWQSQWIRYPVDVAEKSTFATLWSEKIPASQLTQGNYFARAWTRAITGNGDPVGDAQQTFTWNDRPQEVHDLEVTGSTETTLRSSWRTDSDDRLKSFDFYANNEWVASSTNVALSSFTFVGLTAGTSYLLGITVQADPDLHVFSNQNYSPRQTVQTNTVASAITPSQAPIPTEIIIWEDHFETLDMTRWKLEHSTYGDGNNERQCYRPENVSILNGKLVLRAVRETYTCPNGSTRTVTSGMVRSQGLNVEPGQAIEFRVKLTPADSQNQEGLWPAVWASGWAGGGWPLGGEIDWLEVMTANSPRRSVYTVHYQEADGGHGKTGNEIYGQDNFSDAWHTVRFDYGVGGILTWYLDGVQVHQVTDASTMQGWPSPFNEATKEIKINLALGGNPGPLNDAALGEAGATFEIDFIKVVTLSPRISVPASMPTQSPSDPSSGFGVCFPGNARCQVEGQGEVMMQDLELGDKILVYGGRYEPIYSFGHNKYDVSEAYIQLTTETKYVELSKKHMILIDGERMIPASTVKIGDKLQLSSGVLEAVQTISRTIEKGAYAPFTASGTLVVNDVTTSSFIAYQDSESLWIGSFDTGVTHQFLARTFQSSHRIWCQYISACKKETYTLEGLSMWVAIPHKIVLCLFDGCLARSFQSFAQFIWFIVNTCQGAALLAAGLSAAYLLKLGVLKAK